MDYSIEQLRDQYYESIIFLDKEEDIIKMLPQPGYDSFFIIISGLIDKIQKEKAILEEELLVSDKMDVEYIELLKYEIECLEFKLNICKKLEQKNKIEENISVDEEKNKMNLIFATTNSGNIYIFNDLKNIPEEYYDSIIECMNKLEKGINENNNEKGKQLTNNQGLTGIHEVKDYQTRIFYRNIAPDLTYVIMIMIKKSDFSKSNQNEIKLRYKHVEDEYNSIKMQILDPLKREELINRNIEIKDNLYEMLSVKRRGRNV